MIDDSNKGSPQNQGVTDKNPVTPKLHPLPRTFEGKEYYGASDVAQIMGVTRITVLQWHKKELFTADKRTHDGVYLYEIERVMQLKSVYHPNWMRGGYAPAPSDEKQRRITKLTHFFNQLYGKIPTGHFAYLWTKLQGTFSFSIADESQREAMAIKAVELSNSGIDIYHTVNTVNIEPTGGKRGDEFAVSFQTAIVVDIDIRSVAHKGEADKFPSNFEEAKSFLPFTPSILIFSGYGLHAYYIFNQPIKITDENREELKNRNSRMIELVRLRSKIFKKSIDSIGDLPRILRTPSTFNYKLGAENAPICHIVENSGLRFSPDQIDEKLDALTSIALPTETPAKSLEKNFLDFSDDNPDFNIFRVRRMLDFINPSDLTYNDWLAVGMALKNIGCDCSDWEQWSRTDERFKDGECQYKWNGFNRNGYEIGTLFHFAQLGGYDAKEIYREWYELHSDFKSSGKKKIDDNPATQMDLLKSELQSVNKALSDFDTEKNAALEKLRNLEKFDSNTMFSKDIVIAAAFAKIFDKQAFSNLKREIRNYGDKNRSEKVSVNEWNSDVKEKAEEILSRHKFLLNRRTEINAEINSLSFAISDDVARNLTFPKGYSISKENGIEKVTGESMITICRRPVIITGKTYSVDEKIYKVTLAYMTQEGKWKKLAPTEKATVFNHRKLVDLANADLPVTSQNAAGLVEYFDAFATANEINFPLEYSVPRCGWYTFNGRDFFIDPRRLCSFTNENKNISVVVDSLSQFANSLRKVGNLSDWKKIYQLAKKSPVARIIIAAAIAPILLKILGERNFLLYICAPTRAGKTTALYLAASAVGSEKIIRSFDATKNGLAGAAADVNDFVFLVDEKQVADSKLKEQFDTLVYALANGLGRTKLNKDSSLRKLQDWRTIAIMTGETLLLPDNVTGGANTRLLSINVPKEILSADTCRIIHDTIKDNHGLVFPLVQDKIFQLGFESLRETYQNLVALFTTKYPELLSEYCRYMAVLTLADAILNATLTDIDTLPLDDAIQNSNLIFKLIPSYVEISDTARERDFILGFIAQNQNRFIGGNVQIEKMQTIYGKFTKDYVYITVAALKKACADEGFDYKKVATDLIEDGFFVPDDKLEKGYKNPRSTVKVWLAKTTTNCYRFSTQAFKACVSDLT